MESKSFHKVQLTQQTESHTEKQKGWFTKWVNTILKDNPVNDVQTDFKDGLKLSQLVLTLARKDEKSYKSKLDYQPKSSIHELQNMKIVFDFCKNEEKLNLVGIGPQDFSQGIMESILGFIQHLIIKYQIGDKNAKIVPVTEWIQEEVKDLKGVEIKNFTTSFQSGLALSALVYKADPSLLDLDKIISEKGDPLKLNEEAIKIASEKLNIPSILSPEDVTFAPNELAMKCYVCYFRQRKIPFFRNPEDEDTTNKRLSKQPSVTKKDDNEEKLKKEEEERLKKEKEKQEEEEKKRLEDERKKNEEDRLEAERLENERIKKENEDKIRLEEQRREEKEKRKQEKERKRLEEEESRRKQEEERLKKEEQERIKREQEEEIRKQEKEKKRQEKERKRLEEEEEKRKAEEERARLEQERLKKEEEERKQRAEEKLKKKEAKTLMQAELESKRKENESKIKDEMDSLRSTLEKSENLKKSLENEINELKTKEQELNNNLTSLKEESEKKQEELKQEMELKEKHCKSKHEEYENMIQKLKLEFEEIRNSNDSDLEKKLMDQIMSLQKQLETKVSELENNKFEFEKSFKDLKDDYENEKMKMKHEFNQEINKSKSQIELKEKEIEFLKEEALRKKSMERKEHLQDLEKDNEIKILKNEIQDLKSQLKKEELKYKSLEESMEKTSEETPLIKGSTKSEYQEVNGEIYENESFISKAHKKWVEYRRFLFPILNLFFYGLMILVNVLSATTRFIGGNRSDEVSNENPTFFTPAGYAFSIWGFIYSLVGIFVVVQLPYLFIKKDNIAMFEKVGLFFALSCSFNIIWLGLWGAKFLVTSFVVMSFLLLTLFVIYFRVNIGYGKSSRDNRKGILEWIEFFIVQIPFSLYAGWVTAAALANLTVAGVKDPFLIGEQNFAIFLLTITLIPSFILLIWKRDIVYSAGVLWAIIAIGVRQKAESTIIIAAIVNGSILALAMSATFIYELITFSIEKITNK